MATISDISIIDSNTAEATAVESGLERTICSPNLCASKNLTIYRRTVLSGRQLDLQAGEDYHVVYIMQSPTAGAPCVSNLKPTQPRKVRVCCSYPANRLESKPPIRIWNCFIWSRRSRRRQSMTV